MESRVSLDGYNNNDSLYQNKFVSIPNISDVSPEEFQKFIEWYEKEKKEKNKDIIQKNVDSILLDNFDTLQTNLNIDSQNKLTQVSRLVKIDSRNRDIKIYPNANNFRIFLGATFNNVFKIELISTEFPNTANVIKNFPEEIRNNKIYWINQEDEDLGFPIYSVEINPGSYNAMTITKEIESKMNSLKRRNGDPIAPYHYFLCSINLDSDIFTLTSLINTTLSNNPLEFVAGQTTVYVNHISHGYSDGQIIYMQGIKQSAGISSDKLNGAFTITKVNDDKYSYEVVDQAITSVNKAGGNTVKSGRLAAFQLLWDSYKTTPYDHLGFLKENSCQLIPITNPLTTKTVTIDNIIKGINTTTFISLGHGLKSGQKIIFYNIGTLPNISGKVFNIFSVPSPDRFTINFPISYFDSNLISSALIGTGIINLHLPNHGFNNIIDITNSGVDTIQIDTFLPHNLNIGDSVTLNNTNCTPSIDGTYIITNIIDSDTFEISFTGGITNQGTSGTIGISNSFRIYGLTEDLAGINRDSINGIEFTIEDIIDENNFTFVLAGDFCNETLSGGGSEMKISSYKHGFSGVQTNGQITNPDRPETPISLEGVNYCYLCSTIVGTNIVNSTNVLDTFALLNLNESPNMLISNQFLSEPKIFYEGPLSTLSVMDFRVMEPSNYFYNFNGLDFSFTLKITELIDIIKNTNISSRLNKQILF